MPIDYTNNQCPPKGYKFDPELSDSRVAGFVNKSGEQWYTMRWELHPSVRTDQTGMKI